MIQHQLPSIKWKQTMSIIYVQISTNVEGWLLPNDSIQFEINDIRQMFKPKILILKKFTKSLYIYNGKVPLFSLRKHGNPKSFEKQNRTYSCRCKSSKAQGALHGLATIYKLKTRNVIKTEGTSLQLKQRKEQEIVNCKARQNFTIFLHER